MITKIKLTQDTKDLLLAFGITFVICLALKYFGII